MKRVATLILCLLATLAEIEAAKPNVLFIVIDDMNDWISLLDSQSPIKTPNLERLAKRGTLFTNAYCISAACNPSRVATLTGLRPSTSGVYGNKSDWRKALPKRQTLMQQFQLAGYAVRGAGKIFHHQFNGAFHDDASFGDFLPMAPQNMPPKKLNQAPKYGSRNTDWGAWPSDEKNTIDFRTTEYCIRSLKAPPIDKPLFLACGIFKPHSPFFAPSKYHAKLPEIPNPTRLDSDWSDLPTGALKLMQNKKWFWNGMSALDKRIPGSYDDFVRAYAACCLFADAQVGRLLDALDQSPIAKNTIIVLWSDHGFHLGEKDHIEKFALWEKANHVPFIISAPGVGTPGSRCEYTGRSHGALSLHSFTFAASKTNRTVMATAPCRCSKTPKQNGTIQQSAPTAETTTPSEPSAGATSDTRTAPRNYTTIKTTPTNGPTWPGGNRRKPISRSSATG